MFKGGFVGLKGDFNVSSLKWRAHMAYSAREKFRACAMRTPIKALALPEVVLLQVTFGTKYSFLYFKSADFMATKDSLSFF